MSNKIEQVYETIDLGHKTVKVRKWKARDRKYFRELLKDEKNMDDAIIESLVKSCIKDTITKDGAVAALTYNELQYIFVKIRELSISDNFKFSWKCTCEHVNKVQVKIADINRLNFKPWSMIKVNDTIIDFQEVPNPSFYYDKKTDEEINEMAFFTKLINGDEGKTFDDVVEFYEDMPINDIDKLLSEFELMSFSIDNNKEFTCEKCSNKQEFEFDEIPEFFPESWIN